MKKTLTLMLVALVAICLFVGCKNEPTVQTYKVGNKGPAGGIIFYVNPNSESDGWTYLEAASEDLTGSYLWGTTNGDYSTEKEIGKGKSNMDKFKNNGGLSAFPAANACAEYSGGGYTDWFLPSQDELSEMFTNRVKLGMSTGCYWSSTEDGTAFAKTLDFGSGTGTGKGRNSDSLKVRPVRSF